MPSNYAEFNVNYSIIPGLVIPMPSITVKVWASDDLAEDILSGASDGLNGEDLTPLTTDSNGDIVAGSVDVPVGTLLRFRVENFNGMAWCKQEVTT